MADHSGEAIRSSDVEHAGAEAPPERLLSIGQLLAHLQTDFPDLSISKIRYLEDRGLISPQRTDSGYRKYSQSDAQKLRKVLSLQRDEYLPLDVIKRRMDAEGSGRGRSGVGEVHRVSSGFSLAREQAMYDLEEFLALLDASEEFIQSLVEFHLVHQAADTGPAFSDGDLATARICQRLMAFHVEPRNLRLLSSAAEREAGLIEQVATPDLRSGHPDRREHGLNTVQELSALLLDLMSLLLQRELRSIV